MQNNNYLPIIQEENPEIWKPESIYWEPKIGDRIKYNIRDNEEGGGFYCSCGTNMRSHVINKNGYGTISEIDPPGIAHNVENPCNKIVNAGYYKYGIITDLKNVLIGCGFWAAIWEIEKV